LRYRERTNWENATWARNSFSSGDDLVGKSDELVVAGGVKKRTGGLGKCRHRDSERPERSEFGRKMRVRGSRPRYELARAARNKNNEGSWERRNPSRSRIGDGSRLGPRLALTYPIVQCRCPARAGRRQSAAAPATRKSIVMAADARNFVAVVGAGMSAG